MAREGDFRVLSVVAQDATMMEVGDRDRPPGDPPDPRGSWAEKVAGNLCGGMERPESVLSDEFVRARMEVAFPDGEDGEPVITIGKEVLEAMNGLWKRCMVVKVLGRNISIAVVSRKLRELWKPKGGMFVMDLPRQFFMIRFEKEEEYMEALTGGPWRVFGSYLLVRAWSPEFDPLRDEITTTPVWVRLSNVPVTFYHQSIIMGIASGVRNPIKVDMNTLNRERGRFARICVEVDLKKPLKGTVLINGERYFVAYEGLANVCSLCGLYGHLVHTCPKRPKENVVMGSSSRVVELPAVSGNAEGDDGFTLVRGHGKRSEVVPSRSEVRKEVTADRNLRDITVANAPVNIVTENRFGSLGAVMETAESMEVMINSGANKENEILGNHGKDGRGDSQVNGVVFGANLEGSKRGNNESKKGKKNGPFKPIEKIGPKPKAKFVRQNQPVRGLIFGPTRGEKGNKEPMKVLDEMSFSGKRLRVEQEGLGRSGGVIAIQSPMQNEPHGLEQEGGGNGRTLGFGLDVGSGQSANVDQSALARCESGRTMA